MKLRIGSKVTIKCPESSINREWGIVKGEDGNGNYFIAHAEDPKTSLIFSRDELIQHKRDK